MELLAVVTGMTPGCVVRAIQGAVRVGVVIFGSVSFSLP